MDAGYVGKKHRGLIATRCPLDSFLCSVYSSSDTADAQALHSVAWGVATPADGASQTTARAEVQAAVGRFLSAAGAGDVDALATMFAPVRALYREPVSQFTILVDDGQLAFVRAVATLQRAGRVQSQNIDYFTLLRDSSGAWKFVNGS